MGSNVSRHSGKGLSGRRAHSSGNLCKNLVPGVGRVFNACGDGEVRSRDRNRFCGSLPNYLDERETPSGGCTPEALYGGNNNYGEIYKEVREKNVELLFRKLLPQQDLVGGDQGYGSERSPEDEFPLPLLSETSFFKYPAIGKNSEIPFITKGNTFEARLEKGSRGLGLSVTGGIDTGDRYPGLIRIKRIFPHQPAWECGILELGDIILAANGTPLKGLTNHEALEVLRTTPSNVVLKICRPPRDMFLIHLPSPGEPPPPPKRNPAQHIPLSSQNSNSSNVLPLPAVSTEPYGEIDVILKKVNGSLGFTLRKEDESILGHYVRALVREPAISDGRIRPGDKIVSVNGTDISPMSHEEAVMFLRQSGDEVRLQLYRDPAQTPVSALSPTESHKTFRPKPALRKEAMDMLCDLAVRKLGQSDSSSSSSRSRLRSTSPGSSPRRRKLTKTPPEREPPPERPNFLDLCGKGIAAGGETEFDLIYNNEDEVEGSERFQRVNGDVDEYFSGVKETAEPSSMPPIPTSTSEFCYQNPVYQSAHSAVPIETGQERLSDQDIPETVFKEGGTKSLLKWKGVVFTPEDGDKEEKVNGASERSSNIGQLLTVELCRGWNSRLGFSLKGSEESGTLISAIYPDSVAAKDGRLQSGDRVIMINDEPTQDMTTADMIDLLRKVRGTIAITVIRPSSRLNS